MNKSGQYYLSAAVIIILIIATIASLTTYIVTRPQPRTIDSLRSQLIEESSRIIEYGVHENKNVNTLLGDFIEKDFGPLFLKETENANVLFIYGDSSSIYGVRYKADVAGPISASIGTNNINWQSQGDKSIIEKAVLSPVNGMVNVQILEKTYNFKINQGETFHFVIVQEKNGEVFVESN